MTEKIIAGKPGGEKRWAFFEGFDIGTEGDPYLDRLRIIQTPLFAIYLHHIHRPDIDRDPHDHPWAFWSLILAGSYTEEVWPDKRNPDRQGMRNRKRWSIRRTGRKAAHIITEIEGPLWTLVFAGPRRAGWGFWVDGEFVPWKQYIPQPSPETYTMSPLDGGPDVPGRKLVREIVSSGPPEGLTIQVIQETMAMHTMPGVSERTIKRWLEWDSERGLVECEELFTPECDRWRPTDLLMTLLEGVPPEVTT